MIVRTLTNPNKTYFDGSVNNYKSSFQFVFYGSVGILNVLHTKFKALLASRFQKVVMFFRLFACSVGIALLYHYVI